MSQDESSAPPRGAGRIVVGVDGSPSAEQALRWAVGQARLTGQQVDAVITWHVPNGSGLDPALVDIDWAGDSAELLDQTVLKALDGAAPPPIGRHVLQGHPARVLLDAAAHAALLVVGSRGHGGFAGLLPGSVSQHVVAHAVCPVVVVHGDAVPPSPPVP